jgi:creatinine amidohydrolase
MARSVYWQDLTSPEFRELDPQRTIALLPVAAVEQHGPHLPLSTDAVISEGLVRETLQRCTDAFTVLALPPLTVGHSLEHTGFPGTLSASAETLLGLWVDVGRSVERAGIRKLVILNSHGGQGHLVDIAALRLRAELGMFVVRASYPRLGIPDDLFDPREVAEGLHGGEVETSLMLHLRPDLVQREALGNPTALPARLMHANQVLGVERPVGFGWMSQDLHPSGVCGNAARADARRGAALLDHLVFRLIRLLQEVAAAPLETLGNPGTTAGARYV